MEEFEKRQLFEAAFYGGLARELIVILGFWEEYNRYIDDKAAIVEEKFGA